MESSVDIETKAEVGNLDIGIETWEHRVTGSAEGSQLHGPGPA